MGQGQVLVTAPSNIAVDHLAERISQTGLRVVRVQARGLWSAAPRHSVPGPAALCPVVLRRAMPSPALPCPAVIGLRTRVAASSPPLPGAPHGPVACPTLPDGAAFRLQRLNAAVPHPAQPNPPPPAGAVPRGCGHHRGAPHPALPGLCPAARLRVHRCVPAGLHFCAPCLDSCLACTPNPQPQSPTPFPCKPPPPPQPNPYRSHTLPTTG